MVVSAAHAERLPSASLAADYGVLGPSPVSNHGVYSVVGSLNVPVYQEQIAKFRKQLFDEMEKSGGLNLPIQPPSGEVLDQRKMPR